MEFRILGPLEVYDGDRLLPVTGAKHRALLTVQVGNSAPLGRASDWLVCACATGAAIAVSTRVPDLADQLGSALDRGSGHTSVRARLRLPRRGHWRRDRPRRSPARRGRLPRSAKEPPRRRPRLSPHDSSQLDDPRLRARIVVQE